MSKDTRRKTMIANRRQKVSEMYLRGMYQSEIAKKLHCDQATISRDLAELRKEWLDRSINHINQKKAIELAKLDRLEIEYWTAWERSQKDAEKETIVNTGIGTSIVTFAREGQCGNPAFLTGVINCITKRCEILGLNAPKKSDITSGGEPLKGNDDGLNRAVSALADAIREALPQPDAGASGVMAASEQTAVVGSVKQSG